MLRYCVLSSWASIEYPLPHLCSSPELVVDMASDEYAEGAAELENAENERREEPRRLARREFSQNAPSQTPPRRSPAVHRTRSHHEFTSKGRRSHQKERQVKRADKRPPSKVRRSRSPSRRRQSVTRTSTTRARASSDSRHRTGRSSGQTEQAGRERRRKGSSGSVHRQHRKASPVPAAPPEESTRRHRARSAAKQLERHRTESAETPKKSPPAQAPKSASGCQDSSSAAGTRPAGRADQPAADETARSAASILAHQAAEFAQGRTADDLPLPPESVKYVATPHFELITPPGKYAVEGGQDVSFTLEMHPAVENYFCERVWVPKARDTAGPRWPRRSEAAPPTDQHDTALRRRLRRPLRTLMPTYDAQYERIDPRLPLYRKACTRCSQRALVPHDHGCKEPRGSYNTGLFCIKCLTIVATQEELRKHIAQCYDGQLTEELVINSAFHNGDYIRPYKCTVHGCEWRSHLFGCWVTHTILHRFAVLRYGLPARPHYVNMGSWYDWRYRGRNNTMAPPLEIYRMLGCVLRYVRDSDSQYVWQLGMSYNFPFGFPKEHRASKETVVSFDEVLPFLSQFTFRQVQNRTVRDLQYELERRERETRQAELARSPALQDPVSCLASNVSIETVSELAREIAVEATHELARGPAAPTPARPATNPRKPDADEQRQHGSKPAAGKHRAPRPPPGLPGPPEPERAAQECRAQLEKHNRDEQACAADTLSVSASGEGDKRIVRCQTASAPATAVHPLPARLPSVPHPPSGRPRMPLSITLPVTSSARPQSPAPSDTPTLTESQSIVSSSAPTESDLLSDVSTALPAEPAEPAAEGQPARKRSKSSDEEPQDDEGSSATSASSVRNVASGVGQLAVGSRRSSRSASIATSGVESTFILPVGQRLRAWGDQPPISQQEEIYRRQEFSICMALAPCTMPTMTGPLRHTAELCTIKHVCLYGCLAPGEARVVFGVDGEARAYFAPADTTLPAEFVDAPTLIWLQSALRGYRMAGTLAVSIAIGYIERPVFNNRHALAVLGDCD